MKKLYLTVLTITFAALTFSCFAKSTLFFKTYESDSIHTTTFKIPSQKTLQVSFTAKLGQWNNGSCIPTKSFFAPAASFNNNDWITLDASVLKNIAGPGLTCAIMQYTPTNTSFPRQSETFQLTWNAASQSYTDSSPSSAIITFKQ